MSNLTTPNTSMIGFCFKVNMNSHVDEKALFDASQSKAIS